MKNLTRQQTFDLAYRGLASQGFARGGDVINGHFVCKYRGDRGRCCAIGKPEFDDDVLSADSAEIAAAVGYTDQDYDFYQQPQSVHDNSESPEDMKKRLAAFADRFGLN